MPAKDNPMIAFDFATISDDADRESARRAHDLYEIADAELAAVEQRRYEQSTKFFRLTGVYLLPDGKLRADGERVWQKLLSESPKQQAQHNGFVTMHSLRSEIGMRDPAEALRAYLGAGYDAKVEDNG